MDLSIFATTNLVSNKNQCDDEPAHVRLEYCDVILLIVICDNSNDAINVGNVNNNNNDNSNTNDVNNRYGNNGARNNNDNNNT